MRRKNKEAHLRFVRAGDVYLCVSVTLLLLFPLLVLLQGLELICVQLFLQRNLE